MKKFLNHSALFIGLILISYPHLAKKISFLPQFTFKLHHWSTDAAAWQVKPGSIYDGETLRVVRGSEELKIRFCGIDSPELAQPLGIESRDYLRSLIAKGDGTIYVQPIEKDRYNRTVAELWIPIKPDYERQIHLNTAMVEAGYAYHYRQYSGNCESAENLEWAEKIARENKLGVWNGSHQKPWEFRASLSANK